jgi:hypothetical protein
MKRIIEAVFVTAAVALAVPVLTPQAARADVTVTFNPGIVAYGYQDGYWDRDHAWHAWPNDDAVKAYRERNAEHYYDRRHDADHDMGWRGDNWWDHH